MKKEWLMKTHPKIAVLVLLDKGFFRDNVIYKQIVLSLENVDIASE